MSVAVNEILSLSFKGRASRGAYWRTLAALAEKYDLTAMLIAD